MRTAIPLVLIALTVWLVASRFDGRIARLEHACIPTDTGGGVTQCQQPTMREAPPSP